LAIISLVIDFILSIVLWRKLWTLNDDVLRWTNVYFGWSIVRCIFASAADIISNNGTQLDNIVELGVIAAIWVLLYKHLKHIMSSNTSTSGMNTKKTFLWLGGVILAVLALYAIHTAYVFSSINGPALDKESKDWVDTVAPQILQSWDPDVINKYASPEWLYAAPEDKTKDIADMLRSEYGTLIHYATSTGESGIHVNNFTATITAEYVVEADFTKGHARVFIKGIKHGDTWQLLSFYVSSDPNLRWQGGQMTNQPPLDNPGDSVNINGVHYVKPWKW
jgi:hypothetical protein